jgi:hypothetical protein
MDQPAKLKETAPAAAADEEIIELTEVMDDSAAEVVLELPAGVQSQGGPALEALTQPLPDLDPDKSLDELLATLKDFPDELSPGAAALPDTPAPATGPSGPEFPGALPMAAAAPGGCAPIQAQAQEVAQQALHYLTSALSGELARRIEQSLVPAIAGQVAERLAQECGPAIVQGLLERLAGDALPQMVETAVQREFAALKKRWAQES